MPAVPSNSICRIGTFYDGSFFAYAPTPTRCPRSGSGCGKTLRSRPLGYWVARRGMSGTGPPLHRPGGRRREDEARQVETYASDGMVAADPSLWVGTG
jgi:hypothetical protein